MNDDFVYGFLFAVIVVSLVLFSQYGDLFNFLNSEGFTILPSFGTAINWKSAICLSLFFGLFFRNLKGSFCLRLFNAFWILCLCWAVMDLFWILKAFTTGNYLFGSQVLTFILLKDLVVGLTRNCLMVSVSFLFIHRFLRFSWESLFGFVVVVGYWIFLIVSFPYSGYFFSTFIFYSVNFLPFIIAFKSWSGKSWRKFLFA